MLKIDTMENILCLNCGEDKEGVIVSLEERADLEGETCHQCQREIA